MAGVRSEASASSSTCSHGPAYQVSKNSAYAWKTPNLAACHVKEALEKLDRGRPTGRPKRRGPLAPSSVMDLSARTIAPKHKSRWRCAHDSTVGSKSAPDRRNAARRPLSPGMLFSPVHVSCLLCGPWDAASTMRCLERFSSVPMIRVTPELRRLHVFPCLRSDRNRPRMYQRFVESIQRAYSRTKHRRCPQPRCR